MSKQSIETPEHPIANPAGQHGGRGVVRDFVGGWAQGEATKRFFAPSRSVPAPPNK
jgi:hypothetical protein